MCQSEKHARTAHAHITELTYFLSDEMRILGAVNSSMGLMLEQSVPLGTYVQHSMAWYRTVQHGTYTQSTKHTTDYTPII